MRAGYLLDTSVISQLAPGRGPEAGEFAKWISANQDQCSLAAMTIIELERGLAKLKRLGHMAKARALSEWLDIVLTSYGTRVLSLDLETSRLAGAMIEEAIGRGHTPSLPDVLIAASAKRHSMLVMTLNLKDFIALDVQCQDTFPS